MKTAFALFAAIALAGVAIGETLNLNCDWQFRRDCDETWQRVSVPHCVNAHDTFDGHAGAWGEKDQWRGTMFYRKKIVLRDSCLVVREGDANEPRTTNHEPRKYFLEIESIRQTARVRVNGKDCGFYDAGIAACTGLNEIGRAHV